MKKDIVCQEDFDHKIWGASPLIVRGMYRGGSLFDKSAHFFVDLPATKAIFKRHSDSPILHVSFP